MDEMTEWEKTLRAGLSGRLASAALFCLESVGSTNVFLKEKAPELPGEALALAREQNAGVGRRGHLFNTAPGEAMHFSILLRGPFSPLLPLMAGVAVRQALFDLCGEGFSLKWPNDPLAGDRKVGGILCEAVPGGVVCGIGVNLLQPQAFFEAQDLPHAGSVKMAVGRAPSPPELAARLASVLGTLLAAEPEDILRLYAAHCVTLGASVRIIQAGGRTFEGVAESLTPRGELIVRTETGRVTVCAGDVSVRGANGYL